METMDEAIESAVKEMPSGSIFDAHTIIKLLLQKHSDCYLSEMPKKTDSTTKTYHKAIAEKIDKKTDLVEKVGESYSFNIHDKLSGCFCWKRK